MEVKDIIKKRREELSLTYEQLGNMVGVGKSTVRKWETGLIENMRRDNIVALSKALNISPAIIMGWQPIEDDTKLILSQEETTLLENFNKLDGYDKGKVIDYTRDLSNNIKYMNSEFSDELTATKEDNKIVELPKKEKEIWEEEGKEHLMPIACHDDNLTDEEKNRMNDIINNYIKNKQ